MDVLSEGRVLALSLLVVDSGVSGRATSEGASCDSEDGRFCLIVFGEETSLAGRFRRPYRGK